MQKIWARNGTKLKQSLKHCSANQQREVSTLRNHAQSRLGVMQKLRRRVVLVWFDEIDEMVRHRRHGLLAGLRGTDIHMPVNLS
jgi:hypothetical protein